MARTPVLLAVGLQIGISERLVFYPLPTWMAVTGAAFALRPVRNAARRLIRPAAVLGYEPAQPVSSVA
ncbi:hypothetical protein [Nocardia brasiliensis]|uniref:hypothetical protein n=1 Tax=Nocardia brasiliensis TaxID=37326 RepID=UPI00366CEED9